MSEHVAEVEVAERQDQAKAKALIAGLATIRLNMLELKQELRGDLNRFKQELKQEVLMLKTRLTTSSQRTNWKTGGKTISLWD